MQIISQSAPLVSSSVKLFRAARKKQQLLMLDANILRHCYPQQSGTWMFSAGPQGYFLHTLQEGSLLVQVQHPRHTAALLTLHYTELITCLRKRSVPEQDSSPFTPGHVAQARKLATARASLPASKHGLLA